MAIYILLFTLVIILGLLYDKVFEKSTASWLLLFAIILLVSLVSGFRDIGVGTDTSMYTIDYFQAGEKLTFKQMFYNPENLDRGYLFLNYIASLFGNDYWLGLFFTHLFIWTLLITAAVKFKKIDNYSLCLFIFIYLMIFYNRSLNYMRQSCAMSLVFLAYYYYVAKKWKKSISLVIFAIMFHSSAIISLLVPLFNVTVNIKNSKIKILTMLSLFIFMVLITKIFNNLLQFGFEYGLFKDVYLDRYGSSTTTFRTGGFGKETLLLFVLELLIIIDSWRKKYINTIKFQFLLLLHIAYISMYSLTKISEYLYRNSYYFYLLDLFYVAYLLSIRKKKGYLYPVFILCLIICWYTYFIEGGACETYPYTSKILNIM